MKEVVRVVKRINRYNTYCVRVEGIFRTDERTLRWCKMNNIDLEGIIKRLLLIWHLIKDQTYVGEYIPNVI